jgi:photosystem II stability/assembly factor-like uncharacterized protein
MEMLTCSRALLIVAIGCFASGARTEDRDIPFAYSARVINPKLTGSLYEPNSRTLLLWGTDGVILYSTDLSDWHYATTPVAADLTRVAADAQGKVVIAVGERGTILRSEDSGRRWQAVSVGDADFDLRAVVHHASSGAWVAAGTRGTILRSLDSGKTWTALAHELKLTFETLFVEPVSRAILIGGEAGLIGRSTDAGVSWLLVQIKMPDPVTPVTAIHLLGDELIATSAMGRFLTSNDRGESWQLDSMGMNAYFTDATLDLTHGTMLMSSHTGDLFRREASDAAWEKVELTVDGQKRFVSAIRYDKASRSALAVGHHGLAARSTDGGRQWQKIETGYASSMESMAQTGQGRLVGFGEGGYIITSQDSGKTWRRVAPELSLNLREVIAVPDSDIVVASGELGGILRSTDSGGTWHAVDIRYPNMNTPPNLRALVVEPTGNALIAAGAPGTIIRSDDAGQQWRIAHWTPLEKEEAFPWILADVRQRSLAVVEARGSIYSSRDAGKSWQLSKLATDRELWQGSVSANSSVMLIAGQRGVAARSVDGGRQWAHVDTGSTEDLFGSYSDEHSGNWFLLGGKGLILRSSDGGVQWRRVASGTDRALRRMLRHPSTNALMAFGEFGSIVRSTDGGQSWQPITSGTDAELRKGMIEPGSSNMIVVGQQGVILRSSDAGKSWQTMPSHTHRHFRSAVFNPRNGDLIAVGERIVRLTRNPATSLVESGRGPFDTPERRRDFFRATSR